MQRLLPEPAELLPIASYAGGVDLPELGRIRDDSGRSRHCELRWGGNRMAKRALDFAWWGLAAFLLLIVSVGAGSARDPSAVTGSRARRGTGCGCCGELCEGE